MKRLLTILVACLALGLNVRAQQQSSFHVEDHHGHLHNAPRTIAIVADTMPLSHHDSVRLFRKPDAMRAVWMGAIIPGYGQIYNGSYWKLPIVYGGLAGCAYGISYTNGHYSDFKTAYRDIFTDINAGTVSTSSDKSYIAILPEGYTLKDVGGEQTWMKTLQSRQTTWRRYRDYCIVATIAVYALSLIDAYVDAQLFDFDISSDLSMTVEPVIYRDWQNRTAGEVQIALRF